MEAIWKSELIAKSGSTMQFHAARCPDAIFFADSTSYTAYYNWRGGGAGLNTKDGGLEDGYYQSWDASNINSRGFTYSFDNINGILSITFNYTPYDPGFYFIYNNKRNTEYEIIKNTSAGSSTVSLTTSKRKLPNAICILAHNSNYCRIYSMYNYKDLKTKVSRFDMYESASVSDSTCYYYYEDTLKQLVINPTNIGTYCYFALFY